MDVLLGEAAAVITAVAWAVSAMTAQNVLLRTTNAVVNFSKVAVALLGMLPLAWICRGTLLPLDVPPGCWWWLGLSGLLGFAACDALMLQGFRYAGARTTLVVMTGAPLLAACGGALLLQETLSATAMVGISITLLGIVMVIAGKGEAKKDAVSGRERWRGLSAAVGATFFQAAGFLLTKRGLSGCDSIAGTQIRLLAAALGFSLLLFLAPRGCRALAAAWQQRDTARMLLTYGFLGPLLGMGLSLFAFGRAPVGIVSTIISTPPVIMIPLAMIFYREKIRFSEIAGAGIAVAGVAVLFLS